MMILEAKNLQRIYTTRFGGNRVCALSNVSFSVEQGEYVVMLMLDDTETARAVINRHLPQ